jgi:pimeloyl-ACP methyl ester carboxylesterase
MIHYYRALLRFPPKVKSGKNYPVITTPTLMIWGEEDVALTKETTYGTENYVSDFRIRYLPQISHWVQQEAPTATNAMIKAFLLDQPVPYVQWQMNLVPTLQHQSFSAETQDADQTL